MLPFDPRANFASTLMFEFFYNFSKKYVFDRSKDILSDFWEISDEISNPQAISLRFSLETLKDPCPRVYMFFRKPTDLYVI